MKRFTQKHNKALAEITSKTISVLPFTEDTPEKKAERIKQVKAQNWEGFSYFCYTYFPHVFDLKFCDIHKTMFETTESSTGIIGITGFRGLGKTVLMGVVYHIWKIILGSRYIIHTAADIDLAQERTSFTHHELSNNRRLFTDFQELQPLDSLDTDYYLKNKTRIRARSIKQAHRGTINPKTAKRPALIICDDIDKEENIGNQTIGRRKKDKILQEIAGALDPAVSGKVIWLGNLIHPNYAICQFKQQIIDEIKADHPTQSETSLGSQNILKGIEKLIMQFPLETPEGLSVWEEQYPTAKLTNLRAKYGFTGYQREMLGLPVIEGNMFKHHWFLKWYSLPPNTKIKKVWMYADPAWGEKGCFKAIISIAYDGTCFYVLHIWVRQTENTKFFRYYYDTYTELQKSFKSRFRASIEVSYGQERILVDFDRWAKENGLNSLYPYIKRIDNKENKNLRIERTETIIETGRILFPEGQDTPTLISQFLTYPDGYIDGCDALAGCLERFNEYDIGRNRVKVRRLKLDNG